MHDQAYPTIIYALANRSVSTFHHRLRYYTKKLSFSAVETGVHTWQDAARRLLTSTRTPSNVLAIESFLMLSNVSKLLCNQFLMILQVQLAFHEFS